jgi:hypothetical protein
LGLSLCFIVACVVDPTGSIDPELEGETEGEPEDLTNREPAEDPLDKRCPAETAKVPFPVFSSTALVRLPKGVEGMVEQNPFYASMNPSQVESVSCIEGIPGAMIVHGSMGYFEDDAGRTMDDVAQETLQQLYAQLPVTMRESRRDGSADHRTFSAVLDIPPDPQNNHPDPARALITLKSGYGRMYWMVFEAHPNAWNALEATLQATSDSLVLVNP